MSLQSHDAAFGISRNNARVSYITSKTYLNKQNCQKLSKFKNKFVYKCSPELSVQFKITPPHDYVKRIKVCNIKVWGFEE